MGDPLIADAGASVLPFVIIVGGIAWALWDAAQGKGGKCPYCGKRLKSGSYVCHHCGRDKRG